MFGSFNDYFEKPFLSWERPIFRRNKGMRRTQSLNRASTFRYFFNEEGKERRGTLYSI
jgi:hypothetical protein